MYVLIKAIRSLKNKNIAIITHINANKIDPIPALTAPPNGAITTPITAPNKVKRGQPINKVPIIVKKPPFIAINCPTLLLINKGPPAPEFLKTDIARPITIYIKSIINPAIAYEKVIRIKTPIILGSALSIVNTA